MVTYIAIVLISIIAFNLRDGHGIALLNDTISNICEQSEDEVMYLSFSSQTVQQHYWTKYNKYSRIMRSGAHNNALTPCDMNDFSP